jgi:hypothetical protein
VYSLEGSVRSLSLSLTGVLARSTEYVVLAGAPKPWAGSQLACVSRAHWGDSAAVRRSDRQGGYVDTGRSKLAGAVSSLFEMCLWVAGRCNENLAYAPPAFPLRAVRQDMAITDA